MTRPMNPRLVILTVSFWPRRRRLLGSRASPGVLRFAVIVCLTRHGRQMMRTFAPVGTFTSDADVISTASKPTSHVIRRRALILGGDPGCDGGGGGGGGSPPTLGWVISDVISASLRARSK